MYFMERTLQWVRSFTGMGQITGIDYRNGLLYAALSASNVFICSELPIVAVEGS